MIVPTDVYYASVITLDFQLSLNIPFVFSVVKNSTLAGQKGLAVVLTLKIN